MARLSMPLAALLATGLAGCSTYDPYYSSTPVPAQPVVTAVPAAPATAVTTAPAGQVVVAPAANAPVTTAPALAAPATASAVPAVPTYRTGSGTVESVSAVRVAPPSASAGASAPGHTAYRLSVRMDDGTVQSIDQDNRSFMVGDRVQITNAGSVVRR